MSKLTDKLQKVYNTKKQFSSISSTIRNRIIFNIAVLIDEHRDDIIKANAIDLDLAIKNDLPVELRERLVVDNKSINSMIKSLNEIALQPDILGDILEGIIRPNGLKINKIRVPIGVIAIIYESRPNVTIDAAALAIKSGNCIVLRGGKEAINSNRYLVSLIHLSLLADNVSEDVVYFLSDNNRELVIELLKSDKLIDMIIPRGGHSLIKFVVENSTIPVVKHDAGVCHVYVDKYADIDMAKRIVFNSKLHKVSACNALETLLVHKDIAEEFLPLIATMLQELDVDLRSCERGLKYIDCRPAIEEDWYAEYLAKVLAIKIVDDIDAAIDHINKYSSGHSESIVTANYSNSEQFLDMVDSAVVYVNASTRFTDGSEFGLGAEMGISTQKLHVRGPMGAKDLTTIKYQIYGNGQVRE